VPVSSYHFLQGPLVALLALGVIVLLCRWVFATGHRTSPPPATPPQLPADYGLLEVVSWAGTGEEAAVVQDRLRAAGIRSTLAATEPGFHVLVFAADAARARGLANS